LKTDALSTRGNVRGPGANASAGDQRECPAESAGRRSVGAEIARQSSSVSVPMSHLMSEELVMKTLRK
jgi:hypothetical protein